MCSGNFSVPFFLVLICFVGKCLSDPNPKTVGVKISYVNRDKPYKSYVGTILPRRRVEEDETDLEDAQIYDEDDISSVVNEILRTKKEVDEADRIRQKGRSMTRSKDDPNVMVEDNGGDGEKPKWFFKIPTRLMGRAVTYNPNDPKAPRPTEVLKIQEKEAGSKAVPKKKKPKAKKEPTNNSTTDKKKPTVIEYPETLAMNPNAPGWFALKDTTEFGKHLMLGTLLRQRTNPSARKEASNEDYPVETGPGDSKDGANRDASEHWSKSMKSYDRSCMWQEYVATKVALTGPKISRSTRAKVKWQNEQLSQFFLDLVFNSPVPQFINSSTLYDQEPKHSFQLLHLTKKIFFSDICKERDYDPESPDPNKDKIIPKWYEETMYHLFLKLYELTKNKQASDYLSDDEYEWIKSNLETCNQSSEMPRKIPLFTDECREEIISFDQEDNYICTPYIEYDFNIRKYDPLLDFVWHMIASVHNHCFESFQTNPRMWHRYTLALADLFTPEMRRRWSASTTDSKKLYTRWFGPHFESYFDNMNRCMYAATLRSNAPYLLPRFEGNRQTRFAPSPVIKINVTALTI